MTGRIATRFQALKRDGRPGLVTFVTAGDPDIDTSLNILRQLPAAGADIIEVGMPFSDPMADGPAIQASSQRALASGMTLEATLGLVQNFRAGDNETPVVLMGYYNPIYSFGVENFLKKTKKAGVDGIIIVDLPPEEDSELCIPARKSGLDWIRLATPTTDDERLPTVLANASGFIYYVAIMGITGTKSANQKEVRAGFNRLRTQTDLPISVGFGIKNAESARAIGDAADAVVVGSAIVDIISANLSKKGKPNPKLVEYVLGFVENLSRGIRQE